MRSTILAPGSRGDVQPYIALGRALRTLGHDCTIVTTADHEALVTAYGLSVAAIPIDVAAELRRVETQRSVEGGGVVASFRQFSAIAKRAARATVEVALDACRSTDVIITNFGTTLLAGALGAKTGVPVVQAYNVPVTPTGEWAGALFPALDFGALSRRLGHRLSRAAVWITARSSANQACMELLDAPSAPLLPRSSPGLLEGPVLYGISPAFLPRPSDWPGEVEMTGFWFVEEASDFAPPAELVQFLDAGPAPVCIGFGSMSTENPAAVSELVLAAAAAARTRVVLLSGWAGLEPGKLSDDVLALRAVPHSWLFPRCSAIVHHGGAGTTAAAVHAGVPAVVVPFHGDQPFWGSRVQRAGVGPAPIPRKALSAERLADALRATAFDAALRERAAELGRRVREERGATVAAERIAARAR
jgi:UDP:flavonoid glycosyltransferase YjiC (YdhE family)